MLISNISRQVRSVSLAAPRRKQFTDAVTGKLLANVVDKRLACTDALGEASMLLLRFLGEKNL